MTMKWRIQFIGPALAAAITILPTVVQNNSECRADSQPSTRHSQQKNPFPVNDANLAAGNALYVANCASCHGPGGHGDGRAAIDLDPKPADLASPQVARKSDRDLFRKITRGEKPMPGFEKSTSDDQRWLLVLYVRAFANPQDQGQAKK